MADPRIEIFTAVVLDEQTRFTLTELCQCSGANREIVAALVEEGLLRPRGRTPGEWDFPGSALGPARAARRLQHDLGLNAPGIALALELLEELQSLRARLRRLEQP